MVTAKFKTETVNGDTTTCCISLEDGQINIESPFFKAFDPVIIGVMMPRLTRNEPSLIESEFQTNQGVFRLEQHGMLTGSPTSVKRRIELYKGEAQLIGYEKIGVTLGCQFARGYNHYLDQDLAVIVVSFDHLQPEARSVLPLNDWGKFFDFYLIFSTSVQMSIIREGAYY